MSKNIIPVLLLTGYLGSGKTTLLNRILANKKGIKFAVIVNDIGEVNIDADLIEKGGIVGQQDDSLVALQNGCICCTLKMDLVAQLQDIIRMEQFDYIVIEASGICEPAPIAQTICSVPGLVPAGSLPRIPEVDSIVTVVDALRLVDEFGCGDYLQKDNLDDEDLENLVIQQIEFCNIILLNKASEVKPNELSHLKQILRAIQPKAEIIECDYCDIDLDKIVATGMFDFDKVATSAAWISHIEDDTEDEHHHDHHDHDDEEEEHGHHHHHHHDHEERDEHDGHCDSHHGGECTCGCHHHHHHHGEEGEAEEYGISTFVYYARRPFNLTLFDEFVAKRWRKSIIRAKGICYFGNEFDTCYVFEQAGKQFSLRNAGLWYATMNEEELQDLFAREPKLVKDWDPDYGDRMQKLVFIGQKMDKEAIIAELDNCLEEF